MMLLKIGKHIKISFLVVSALLFSVDCCFADGDDGETMVQDALGYHKDAATGEAVATGIQYISGLKQSIEGLLVTKEKMDKWKDLYDQYKHTMEYIEVVSENVRLYNEIESMTKKVKEILALYTKYHLSYIEKLKSTSNNLQGVVNNATNVGYINSLYDLDKYLNPEHIDWFGRRFEKCMDHAQQCFMHASNVMELSSAKNQLRQSAEINFEKKNDNGEVIQSGKDGKKKAVRMMDSERLNEIFAMDRELDYCLYEMYNIIYQKMALARLRKHQIEESTHWGEVFDYTKYHYTWR